VYPWRLTIPFKVHAYIIPLCPYRHFKLSHKLFLPVSVLNLAMKSVIKKIINITIKYEGFGSHSVNAEN
jgi:hypothetical protein